MSLIRAKVLNGRVETDAPIDLPDGTEVSVIPRASEPVDGSADVHDDDDDDTWDDSPEGIAARLKAFDELEPLILTDEDRKVIAQARADQRAWEFEHADEYARKLQRMFE